MIEQRFPDALSHLYVDQGINQKVPLYSGRFQLNEGSGPGDFDGEICFNWLPSARTEASGEAEISFESLSEIFPADDDSHWSETPTASFAGLDAVVKPPGECRFRWSKADRTHYINERLGDQYIGDEAAPVDRVTFFVPNGWAQSSGAINICDPNEPWVWWRGRLEIDLDDWIINIDLLRDMRWRENWAELRRSGGSRFTHVGELRRKDGSDFAYADIVDLLHQLGLSMSLTLGRWVRPLLPVGWSGDNPRWSSWRVQPIDRMISVHTWSDSTEFPAQLSEVTRRVVEFCKDAHQAEVLQYAVAYYVSINVNTSAELTTAIPISALQMLAYDLFVEQRRTYTRSKWENLPRTEEEIRLLLDDCGIDLNIPDHMPYLKTVSDVLGPTPEGHSRDALRCIVDMRNLVIHPKRDKPIKWQFEQWVEASIIACHYLELAILRVIGFAGKARSPLRPSVAAGAVYPVPWI
ncbi:hypothetical protein [Saccharothrix deserti]|uniref:hypothetical protein n=1 Tax=Saccharothrix deserti TaxID=2593674 RepID=UPI00131BA450|nr:hypothetical protein [Saccharothrix deserti]